MKPYHKFAGIAILAITAFAGCNQGKKSGPGLTVLTYSSLGGKEGFLELVREEFLSKTQCDLRIETTLGAGQVISYLEEEKSRARIDVVMGMDELLFERAKSFLYQSENPKLNLKAKLVPLLHSHLKPGFIPMDYGALTFIYRKADFKKPPTTLSDLLKPEFKKKWIVQDPRASSSGMIFFLMAKSQGIQIKQMKNQWVTLAPSWESSYKMFIAKEASLAWSYLTSLAYHRSQGEGDQYAHVDFKEGLPLQVEGMAIVNKVGNPLTTNPCIEKWTDFMLTKESQSKLAMKQWMMPAVRGTSMAKLFETLPPVNKSFEIPMNLADVDALISRFGLELQGE